MRKHQSGKQRLFVAMKLTGAAREQHQRSGPSLAVAYESHLVGSGSENKRMRMSRAEPTCRCPVCAKMWSMVLGRSIRASWSMANALDD